MTNLSQNTAIQRSWGLSKYWNWLLKLLISLILIYFIYNQITTKGDLFEIWNSFKMQLRASNPIWIICCIILMPFNFIVENWKWRNLLGDVRYVTFWTSLRAILCGSTLGIMTPNRLGEYGGRILYFDSKDNWKAVIATGVGNLAQLIVILCAGWIGAIFFFYQQIEMHPFLTSGSVVIGFSVLIFLGILYFNIDLAIDLFKRIPLSPSFKRRVRKLSFFQNLEILRSYDIVTLKKVLSLAFLKYLIYMTQYLLLLYFFGIEISLLPALTGIATIYLIQTSIPLPAFMGLLARGELALIIWGFYCELPANILGATFTLWILNLLIPALLGLILIYKVNILKSLGYD